MLDSVVKQKPLAGNPEKLYVVFSDIEMGPGGLTDDFPHSEFLADILLSFLEGPCRDLPTEFIFNGDTFDLLKTPYLGHYPHHITKEVATAKMASVAAAHPKFFEAVSAIMEHPAGGKKTVFVVGNHDAELLFPKVQGFIRGLLGGSENILFPGHDYTSKPIHFEHGSQSDPMFYISPDMPFIEADGKHYLNVSWAAIALLDVVIPLAPEWYVYDRMKPRKALIQQVPEIRELFYSFAWKYWGKDFWRNFISLKDPVMKFNWTMVKEIIRQLTATNPDVYIDKGWLEKVVDPSPCELFFTGHLHQIGTFYHGAKRIIQSGCFRDEFFIEDEGKRFRPALKNYYLAGVRGGRVVFLESRELPGPPAMSDRMPKDVFTYQPKMRSLLDEIGDRDESRAEQIKQERREQGDK